MNTNIKEKIALFRSKTADFAAGNVSVKDYKSFSGFYGSYAQRGAKNSMLRLRITGGQLSKDGLKSVIDICGKYNIELIHCTTCQTLQLHNIPLDKIADVITDALERGFYTIGGGGDFPRNVMISPLSGVEKGENFDVSPYALSAAKYLLEQADKVKMPRKLKVCFSNSPKNAVHATFRDLGFVSRADGLFDVYCAGGMGANPKMGVKVDEAVQPCKVIYYIRAMIALFCKYGNYENRARARTRYLQDVLGGRLRDEFLSELSSALESGGLDIDPEITVVSKTGEAKELSSPRVSEQKQSGLYSVLCHPAGGLLDLKALAGIYDTIKDMEDVSVRISPNEEMYIINCTGTEAQRVLKATDFGGEKAIERSVACIGASICQQGLRDSQGLLRMILEAVKPYDFPADALPQLHISGCMSSCGTHEIGSIGFMGRVKMIGKKPVPGFSISLKGCGAQGKERFGDEIGVMATEDIPRFIVRLAKAVTAKKIGYDEYCVKYEDELMKLIGEYI